MVARGTVESEKMLLCMLVAKAFGQLEQTHFKDNAAKTIVTKIVSLVRDKFKKEVSGQVDVTCQTFKLCCTELGEALENLNSSEGRPSPALPEKRFPGQCELKDLEDSYTKMMPLYSAC